MGCLGFQCWLQGTRLYLTIIPAMNVVVLYNCPDWVGSQSVIWALPCRAPPRQQHAHNTWWGSWFYDAAVAHGFPRSKVSFATRAGQAQAAAHGRLEDCGGGVRGRPGGPGAAAAGARGGPGHGAAPRQQVNGAGVGMGSRRPSFACKPACLPACVCMRTRVWPLHPPICSRVRRNRLCGSAQPTHCLSISRRTFFGLQQEHLQQKFLRFTNAAPALI